MTLVVPDSNILYSCLRTANSKARRILLTRNDIDPKDTLFVALVLQYDGQLWTRDEELRVGLWKKGFRAFFEEE